VIPGSDPVPLALLRNHTAEALADLAGLRSHDPAAANALRTIRLTRHTLEYFWMPALDSALDTDSHDDDTL
jgi:hypothetical protein